VTPSLRADQTPSGWLPADSSIWISILKATDNNDFPFFSQPFSGMTDEMTSFQDILLSAHSLYLHTKNIELPSELFSQCEPAGFPSPAAFFSSSQLASDLYSSPSKLSSKKVSAHSFIFYLPDFVCKKAAATHSDSRKALSVTRRAP
jgi:hypothetical protein